MNKKGLNLQRISFGIMIVTLVSKALGFFREIVFSYFYGTTSIADAYIFSLTISTIIFGFIGTGLTTSFIPVYTTVKEKNSTERANEFTSNLISGYLLICLIIIVLVLPNTKYVVNILASGFNEETAELSALFCRFSVCTVVATGIVSILSGLLQINRRYFIPAAVGIPLNIILISSIMLSQHYGFILLGIGNLVAVYFEIVFLIPSVNKIKYKYRYAPKIRDEYISLIVSLAIPIIISASVNQINVLIDKSLASNINGGVSILNYSHTIVSIVNDVVISSFVTAIYPRVTGAFVKESKDTVKSLFSETLVSLLFILIPAAVFLFIESEDIILFFYGRGAFSFDSVKSCSEILGYYALGIPFVGIRQLLIRFFYAKKDTKTPVINASIAVTINIILNFPFMKIFGLGGLALVTSVSAILADVLLWYSMNKSIKLKISLQDRNDLIRIGLMSVVVGVITMLLSKFIQLNVYVKLIMIFITVALVYILCLYLLNVTFIRKVLRKR